MLNGKVERSAAEWNGHLPAPRPVPRLRGLLACWWVQAGQVGAGSAPQSRRAGLSLACAVACCGGDRRADNSEAAGAAWPRSAGRARLAAAVSPRRRSQHDAALSRDVGGEESGPLRQRPANASRRAGLSLACAV